MSDRKDKTYTPQEVAVAVLKKAEELMKAHVLAKANTAHEIETGQEPESISSECPEYLAEADLEGGEEGTAGESKNKKKGKVSGELGDIEGDESDESDPEHEDDMSPAENADHDSKENDADEKDSNKIEADEESKTEKEDVKHEKDEDKDEDESEDESSDESEDEGEKKDKNKKPFKKPFEKSEKIAKSMFELEKKCSPKMCKTHKRDKKDIRSSIQYRIKDLQEIRDCKYIVEEEFPKHKEIFEKIYSDIKQEIQKLINEHSKVKKSEAQGLQNLLNKTEKNYQHNLPHDRKKLSYSHDKENRTISGKINGKKFKTSNVSPLLAEDTAKEAADKKLKSVKSKQVNKACKTCGQGIIDVKKKPSKLKNFLSSKKNKKMEKFLGLGENSTSTAATPAPAKKPLPIPKPKPAPTSIPGVGSNKPGSLAEKINFGGKNK